MELCVNIQKIDSSHLLPTADLDDWSTVGLPLSEPPCQLRGRKIVVPGKEEVNTGIWECKPGQFRREIEAGEMMHILTGECIFTPDHGDVIHMVAGDTLYFAPNTTGIWDIKSTVRKVYVLL